MPLQPAQPPAYPGPMPTPITPTDNTEPTPELLVGQSFGQPGSIFRIDGQGFPASTALTVVINQQALTTVQSDANGAFVLFVNTDRSTPPGTYTVTLVEASVTSADWPATALILDRTAPLVTQAPAPDAFSVALPQQAHRIFLPQVQR